MRKILDTTAKAAPLKFVAMELAPYGMIRDDGKSGIFFDTLTYIGKALHTPVQVEILNLARVMRNIHQGHADCSLFIENPVSDEKLAKIAAIGWSIDTVIYSRKDKPVKTYSELFGLQLAFTRGATFGHALDTDPRLNKTITKNYRQSLVLLQARRVDAVAGTSASLGYLVKTFDNLAGKLAPPFVLAEKGVYLYCRKNIFTGDRLEQVRHTLKTMRDSGVILKIIDGYLK